MYVRAYSICFRSTKEIEYILKFCVDLNNGVIGVLSLLNDEFLKKNYRCPAGTSTIPQGAGMHGWCPQGRNVVDS